LCFLYPALRVALYLFFRYSLPFPYTPKKRFFCAASPSLPSNDYGYTAFFSYESPLFWCAALAYRRFVLPGRREDFPAASFSSRLISLFSVGLQEIASFFFNSLKAPPNRLFLLDIQGLKPPRFRVSHIVVESFFFFSTSPLQISFDLTVRAFNIE